MIKYPIKFDPATLTWSIKGVGTFPTKQAAEQARKDQMAKDRGTETRGRKKTGELPRNCQLSSVVSVKTYLGVVDAAKAEGKTISSMIEMMITEWLEQHAETSFDDE